MLCGGLAALFILSGCQSGKEDIATEAIPLESKSIRTSGLVISLPRDYKIEETIGPDFTVYYFTPGDKQSPRIGNAGIYFGDHPQLFGNKLDTCVVVSKEATLLGKDAIWKIYDCGEEFTGETVVRFDSLATVHAFANASKAQHLDSLITLIGSLHEKD